MKDTDDQIYQNVFFLQIIAHRRTTFFIVAAWQVYENLSGGVLTVIFLLSFEFRGGIGRIEVYYSFVGVSEGEDFVRFQCRVHEGSELLFSQSAEVYFHLADVTERKDTQFRFGELKGFVGVPRGDLLKYFLCLVESSLHDQEFW